MRGTPILLLVMMTVMNVTACASPYPDTYSAKAMEAKIIDAETKQPIEGVVVVAHWPLLGGMEGGSRFGSMMVLEAVTDQNGRFAFPAWGPLKRPKELHLRDEDPGLIFFKPGYLDLWLSNSNRGNWLTWRGEPVRRSDWSGKTIEMNRFKGSMQSKEALRVYADRVSRLTAPLESILSEECGWKKVPRMVLGMNEQSMIFRKHGLYALPSIESLDIRYSNHVARCGSVKEFFRDYQP